MRKLIQLMITVALLLGLLMSAAQADVGTLGISLVGRVSNGGEETVVPLTGVFRVLRDGEEIGVLSPGETMTLSGLNRVRLEPKPETFPAGWDLTAAFCEAPMDPGGTTIIQVALTPLTDESAGQRMNAGTTAEPENNSESGEDSQAVSSVMTPVATKMPDVIRVSAEPTAAPTPEPVLQPVSGGSATLTVKAFQDLNGNGYQGDYEGPISGMTAYLMTRDGAAVATGKAGDDGLVVFSGLPAGKYTVRAYLPEGWYFTRKGSPEDPTASWFDDSALGEGEAAVSLAEGEARTIGVGLGKGLTVSGVCWVDATSDGIRKEGEPVLCGVRLTLDGQKNGLHFEAVSGEDGSWRFDRVRPGFYDFTAYVPDGMMFAKYSRTGGDARSYFTTEGVKKASRVLDLNDKESRTGINVGFSQSALITGICFLDANYNGFYDEGEQPLPGVKISAIKQVKDEEVAQVISGEDGSFQITGLRGNTYKIRALLPADGSSFTLAVDDASGNHFKGRDGRRENFWTDFVLRDAETRQVNVGAIYPASVTGTVYMDTDFSGTMGASEKIVTGFQVDILDEGGNLVASDRTSVKGRYELKSLTPGIYSLRVTAMKGYAFTRRGEENVILNLTGGAGYSEPFSLAIGETKSHMDIGMIQPGRVEGVVFADRNDNGLRDSGEDGLPGVQVRLLSEGEEVFRAEIGAEGSYLFDAVMPGEYTLEYTLPEGAIFAKAVSGGNTVSGDRTGVGKAFTLASGGAVTAPLCGALTLGEISGSAWQDSDGDGRRAEEEVPQAGLTVTLTPSRDDMEPMTVTTEEDGSFSLTGLRPDTWQLSVVCPEGKVLSRTEGVRLPLIPGENSQTVALEVPMGEVWRDQALGIVIPAALSGQAFLDENNNGLFDEGEATPAGLEVTVHDDWTGTVYRVLTTDLEGRFETSGMIPGTFTLTFPLDENTLPTMDGDSVFEQQGTQLVLSDLTLAEDEREEGLLLGIVRYTSLSGRVWIDRGEGVEALSAAELTLKDENGETLNTLTTGEDGAYTFGRLMPGVYVIEALMPEGCVLIEPGDPALTGERRSVITHPSNRTGVTDPIEVRMDRNQTGLDMGCVLPGRLGDLCWLDVNGDGYQGMGEYGLEGVRIELLRGEQVIAETRTDAYGFYRFVDLYPAAYTLRVYAPDEVKPTLRKTDIPMIVSSLEETDSAPFMSVPVQVESNRANYNADLGFALRTPGVYPAGYGQAPTQDWSPGNN